MSKDEVLLNISQIAVISKRSRQTIYCAIRNGRLQASKTSKGYIVSKSQFDKWISNKYDRRHLKYNGEEIFDFEKGILSVLEASNIYSAISDEFVSVQKIYYLIRTGRLQSHRKGSHYIIQKHDLLHCISETMSKEILYFHVKN